MVIVAPLSAMNDWTGRASANGLMQRARRLKARAMDALLVIKLWL
jgi:hypothetical protein